MRLNPILILTALVLELVVVAANPARSRAASDAPDFQPCSPVSEFANVNEPAEEFLSGPKPSTVDFCATWNPEWAFLGHRCCAKFVASRRRSANRCAAQRRKASYCDEMTPEQRDYSELAATGKLGDLLQLISLESGSHPQSYCNVNNGFLAYGRRLVPSAYNRIEERRPERCVDFGTDGLVGMLEWVGREVAKEYAAPQYSGVHLVVGDLSAPRGGCLSGRNGRRGHISHTSGVDVDIGYLSAKENRPSPQAFHRDFDAKTNWWMVKRIFRNPFACVKVIFLDRRNIAKLARAAGSDPDWERFGRFIRHVKYHRDHMHVRVGDHPGRPGCVANPHPELEQEENADLLESGSAGASQDAEIE